MPGILCIGIAVQDYVFGVDQFPTTPEKHRARSVSVVGGGLAANAAVAAARLGGGAMLASRLGEDSVGRDIVAELEGEGVDCSLVRRFAGRSSSMSAVLVDRDGERMVINYGDDGIPDDPGWLPDRLPDGVKAVLGDTRWESGALKMFAVARREGAAAVLDGDRAVSNRALLEAATHLVFAAQAAREMTGRDDARDALRDFPAPHTVSVTVTDGVRGAFVRRDADIVQVPAFPVRAIDTLAAGDVFHGAFTQALAEGMDEIEALRFSSAVAAIKCTRFGGRKGSPTRAEVDQFLQERTS